MFKKLTIRETNDSDDFMYKEISETIENSVINLAEKVCTLFSFKKYSNADYNDSCAHFMHSLSPYVNKKVKTATYMYEKTELWQDVYFYTIDKRSIETLRLLNEGFDDFVAPFRPDDLCFYYDFEQLMFYSITRDGFYELYLTEAAYSCVAEEWQAIQDVFREKTADDWNPKSGTVNIYDMKN